MIKKSDWQTVHDEMLEEERRRLGEPPTAEELFAYARGTMSAKDEERIQAFLVAYPELAAAMSEPFPDGEAAPGEPGYVSDEEIERRLDAFHARVAPRPEPLRGGRVVTFWKSLAAAAAVLAAASSGLFWQAHTKMARLESELARPKVAWEEQLLREDGRRGAPDTAQTLPGNAEMHFLVGALVRPEHFSDYRVEILDLSSRPVRSLWSSREVQRRSNGTFGILVPGSFLKPGAYRIVLYGVDGSQEEEELASYSIRVVAADRGSAAAKIG
jgi:hypothetical protein